MPEIVVAVGADALHARPAARIVRVVAAHDVDVRIACADDPASEADARSITAILALGVGPGDRVRVTANGPGAAEILEAVRVLIEDEAAQAGGVA